VGGGADYPGDDYEDERAWFPGTLEVLGWLARRWQFLLCLGAVAGVAAMAWLVARRLQGSITPIQSPW
jgi:hypothetical protein